MHPRERVYNKRIGVIYHHGSRVMRFQKGQQLCWMGFYKITFRTGQAIETGHLLKAVVEVGENVTHFIFNKLGVNSNNLLSALDPARYERGFGCDVTPIV